MEDVHILFNDREKLKQELLKVIVCNPKSMNQLGTDIGISPLTLRTFLAGKFDRPTATKTLIHIIKYITEHPKS